jgi:phage terminase large subunit
VRQFKLNVTKDSLNLIKELRNFRYIEDKNGVLTSKTTHAFSHLLDAVRYGVIGKLEPQRQEKIYSYSMLDEVLSDLEI